MSTFYFPADGCKDPGIPPGAIRSGNRFQIGDQVKYRCQSGMDLLGPEVRVCLDSKEWSGPEPRCKGTQIQLIFFSHISQYLKLW